MDFETLKPSDAAGWYLAHSVKIAKRRISKGTLVTNDHIDALQNEGIDTIQVYRLGSEDIEENEIAGLTATSIADKNIALSKAARGRVDLRAGQNGQLSISDGFEAINKINEGLSIATLPQNSIVNEGDLVATIKIIPYALPKSVLEQIKNFEDTLCIKAFRPYKATIINSDISDVSPAILDRLHKTNGHLQGDVACAHDISSIQTALIESIGAATDIILLVGKSAIADRRDIMPSALEKAGGEVHHLGMPADPGNLLMLGSFNGKIVIGVPSCAKSHARNGFDIILESFALNGTVSKGDIESAGIGGLLKTHANATRDHEPSKKGRPVNSINIKNTAIILAAGNSRRASVNKLLAKINEETIVNRAAQNIINAHSVTPEAIIVVTGRDAPEVKKSISDTDLCFSHNADFKTGLASSLRCGLEKVSADAEFILIALADMPFIKPATIKKLFDIAHTNVDKSLIFIPTFNGKRGNPVLWHASLLHDLRTLDGDMGGKQLMKKHAAAIKDVPVDDPGILIDLDTQEALAQFGAL